MAGTPPCPAPTVLKKLLDGSLPDGEQASLARHLEACAACQRRLQELAAGDGSWAALVRHLGNGPAGGEALRQAMARLRDPANAAVTEDDSAAGAARSLDFLDPASKPRQLGKLDHYEIIEVVGSGGMGIVFKALDPALRRIVAVKVMAPQFAAAASARQRFLREARAAAAVCHEHVVTIHAVAETKGLPYLVMQFVAGASLQERLERRGAPNLDEILRIGMQTAQGLAAAHKQGLVHRDIKPANILLENGVERVKITDFGLARAGGDARLTQSGVIVGTPQYMAPEQARGEAVDQRADLFSLGSVLYFACTGRPPFQGDSSLAVLRQVSDTPPPPLREVNPDVPEWLAEIIGRLHAKDPAERYQSADEVAAVLGEHYVRLRQSGAQPLPPRRPKPPPRLAPSSEAVSKPAALQPSRPAAKTKKSALPLVLILSGALVLMLGCAGLIVGPVAYYWFGPNASRTVSAPSPDENAKNQEAPRPAVIRPEEEPAPLAPAEPKQPPARPATPDKEPTPAALPERPDTAPQEPPRVAAAETTPVFPRLAEEPIVLEGHTDAVWSVAFSPDGKQLASGGKDRKLRLWDLATRKETDSTGIFVAHLEAMTYSKDGSLLYIGDGPAVRVWNIKDRKMRVLDQGAHSPNRNLTWIHGIALSPDGNTLAVGFTDHYYDDTARPIALWDLPTGPIRATLNNDRLGKGVYSLAYSPDGSRLATSSGDDVRIWDTRTNKQVALCKGHNGRVRSLAYSPDGKLLATASFDKTARLWDGKTGEDVLVLEGHTDRVHALAFSPDGKTLATGSVDGTIRFWDVPSGKPQGSLEAKATEGGTMAFSPDGKWFAVGCLDKSVRLWPISAQAPTVTAEALPPDLDLVPGDGALFLSVQVARTWEDPLLDPIRKKAETDKNMAEGLKEMKRIGLEPENIERIVLVWWGRQRTPYSVGLITTVKPYDRQRVLVMVDKGGREEKVGNKSVILSPVGPMGMHFINERSFIFGRAAEVKKLLEHPARRTRKAAWNEVLRAAPRHTLYLGAQHELLLDDPKKHVPPGLDVLKPLLDARMATASLEVGKEPQLTVRLTFANGEDVKAAEGAARQGLDMAAVLVNQFVEQFRKNTPPQAPPPLAKVVAVMQDAEKAVKKATLQGKERTLECRVKLESADWPEALAAGAVMLSASLNQPPSPPRQDRPAPRKVVVPKTPAEAEAAIKKLGGQVEHQNFDDKKPITQVRFIDAKLTDDDLVVLSKLSELEKLWLSGTEGITDEGVKHLRGLTNLEWLSISKNRITDASLAEIKRFKKLEHLVLYNNAITDSGLVHLKELTDLTYLDLSLNEGITDAGLEHLKGLAKLEELSLFGTKVSDKGVEALKKALPRVKVRK